MAAKKKPAKRATVRKAPVIFREPELLKLDLGSGPRPAEGFKGVDIVRGVTDFEVDLCSGQPWPFATGTADELRSSHFIEHIDAVYIFPMREQLSHGKTIFQCSGFRLDALLWFFDEAFRIAKPGAVFTVQWPALQSVRAFQDPTHRRFIPAEMITYLSIEGRKAMGVEHYGATCNWIGHVQPTIPGPTPEEQKESELMALRADSSDEKQAWMQKQQAEQGRRYRETWGFAQDFIAVLKAVK
jgi:hypothetical protein